MDLVQHFRRIKTKQVEAGMSHDLLRIFCKHVGAPTNRPIGTRTVKTGDTLSVRFWGTQAVAGFIGKDGALEAIANIPDGTVVAIAKMPETITPAMKGLSVAEIFIFRAGSVGHGRIELETGDVPLSQLEGLHFTIGKDLRTEPTAAVREASTHDLNFNSLANVTGLQPTR